MNLLGMQQVQTCFFWLYSWLLIPTTTVDSRYNSTWGQKVTNAVPGYVWNFTGSCSENSTTSFHQLLLANRNRRKWIYISTENNEKKIRAHKVILNTLRKIQQTNQLKRKRVEHRERGGLGPGNVMLRFRCLVAADSWNPLIQRVRWFNVRSLSLP